ncbi:hypothetical protein HBN54_003103 [Hymenobacter sp. 1B]|uniref:Uncharacterized protein n=1 Tax=Hymenobacter artigasi TaxID=2719616 RepID=A0ABX1HJQ8_9BACT|nr:hypothetical protein [Hymenobacter artigasi]
MKLELLLKLQQPLLPPPCQENHTRPNQTQPLRRITRQRHPESVTICHQNDAGTLLVIPG